MPSLPSRTVSSKKILLSLNHLCQIVSHGPEAMTKTGTIKFWTGAGDRWFHIFMKERAPRNEQSFGNDWVLIGSGSGTLETMAPVSEPGKVH